MAKPKGKHTRLNKSQEPVILNEAKRICEVTGETFYGWEEQDYSISKEGWAQLKKSQINKLIKGESIDKVL